MLNAKAAIIDADTELPSLAIICDNAQPNQTILSQYRAIAWHIR